MPEVHDPSRRGFLLGRFASASRPASSAAVIDIESCLAFSGVVCMSCRDACQSGAVRFMLAAGGARPSIDHQFCTGCGDCTRACPADAVRLQSMEGAP